MLSWRTWGTEAHSGYKSVRLERVARPRVARAAILATSKTLTLGMFFCENCRAAGVA